MVFNRLKFGLVLLILSWLCFAQESTSRKVGTVSDIPSSHLIKKVKPTFPPGFKPRRKFNGTVVLKLTINTAGEPFGIQVIRGDKQLTAAAVDAIRQWRWEPMKLNGKAVEVDTVITVNFEPKR